MKKRRVRVLAIFFFLAAGAISVSSSSNLPAHWFRTFGGEGSQGAFSISQTSDGGLIIGGQTSGAGYYDLWLVKTDSSGRILWQKTAPGDRLERVDSAVETTTGEILAAAIVWPPGSIDRETRLLKFDPSGIVLWQ